MCLACTSPSVWALRLTRDCKVLRVMPDDNSCMCKCRQTQPVLMLRAVEGGPCRQLTHPFRPVTAFGGAIGLENPSRVLRDKVADYILQHPDEYSKAILGDDPVRYTSRMRQMDTWGGAIELAILSQIYDVEISSIDVKACLLARCSLSFLSLLFSVTVSPSLRYLTSI